jgi:hypothetical protein
MVKAQKYLKMVQKKKENLKMDCLTDLELYRIPLAISIKVILLMDCLMGTERLFNHPVELI